MMLTFTVPGRPVAKGRPRFARRGDYVTTYTPDATVRYEDLVAFYGREAMRLGNAGCTSEPVRVELVAVFPRPGRLNRRKDPAGRMVMDSRAAGTDIDNVAKAILDGLQRGGLLVDDKQVVELLARKVYAAKGEEACVEVVVELVGLAA
jgi:Holliday junction resolvase RusA-like endonuclease